MDDVPWVDFDNVDLPAFFASDEPENKIYRMFSNVRHALSCGGDMWKNELNINMKLICNSNRSLPVTSKPKLKSISLLSNATFADDSVYQREKQIIEVK